MMGLGSGCVQPYLLWASLHIRPSANAFLLSMLYSVVCVCVLGCLRRVHLLRARALLDGCLGDTCGTCGIHLTLS
jgi:hypothetical protein